MDVWQRSEAAVTFWLPVTEISERQAVIPSSSDTTEVPLSVSISLKPVVCVMKEANCEESINIRRGSQPQ